MPRIAVALVVLAGMAARPLCAQQVAPVLEARVFMDFNYLETERPAGDGFSSGQLAGHLVATLTDRLTFFGETSATPTDARFNVEVERAILRYDHADWFRVSAGRYHTPVSFWNVAFHHGQWLQTTVARPQVIRFGGTFLPVHFVGAMAEGRVAPGAGTVVGYTLGVGNGRAGNLARAGDAGDANDSRAVTAGATVSLPGRRALRAGVSYYVDRLTPAETSLDVDERIFSAHLARERENPEVIAEYTRVTHEPHGAAGEATHSEAYYAQVAYRLTGGAHAFKPYLRAERVRPSGDDPIFAPLELGYEGLIGGLRYDVGPTAALKVEYRSERFQGESWAGSIAAQLSFTFAVRGHAERPVPPPEPTEEHHGAP